MSIYVSDEHATSIFTVYEYAVKNVIRMYEEGVRGTETSGRSKKGGGNWVPVKLSFSRFKRFGEIAALFEPLRGVEETGEHVRPE